jgi:hypothetical protein
MDHFCKSYAKTDFASLHYVTFIKPLVVFSTEALSFDSDEFTVNSMRKVIEWNINDSFVLLKEHFFHVVLLYKKNYELKSEDMSHEVLEFFSEP